jgi:hypothetical protein
MPDHEHLRRRNGAGGRRQHREHLGQSRRGEDRRLVARHGGLRRQHVHRLRARYPREQVQGIERVTGVGDLSDRFGDAERIGDADEDRAGYEAALEGERVVARAAEPHAATTSARCTGGGDLGAVCHEASSGNPA